MNRNVYGFPVWTHAHISWQAKHQISETNSSNISKLYCQLFSCFHIGKPQNSLKIFFFLFFSIIEKLCQTVVVHMDAQIVGKKMGIEFFTNSHVERNKSNKNFEKKVYSSMQERNWSEQHVNVHYLGRVSLSSIREESLFQIH